MMGDRNLLAKDEDQRANSIQYVKDVIKMVSELDEQMVSVVPGTVGKLVPDGRPEQEWEWAVTSMKEIYEYAESKNVLIGIEPINRFETYFVNRGDQALALAEADRKSTRLNSSHVAISYAVFCLKKKNE